MIDGATLLVRMQRYRVSHTRMVRNESALVLFSECVFGVFVKKREEKLSFSRHMYDEVYIKETNKMAEYPGARKKKTDTRRERDASAVEKANKNSIELCSTCIVSVLIYIKSKSVRRTRERTSDRLFLRYGCFAASVSLSRLFSERFFQSLSFLSFFLSLSSLFLSLSLSLALVLHSGTFSCVVQFIIPLSFHALLLLLLLFLFFSRLKSKI